jgi:hypothetical protein
LSNTPNLDRLMRGNRQAILAACITVRVTGSPVTAQLMRDQDRHEITESEITDYIETMALARAFALIRNPTPSDAKNGALTLIRNFIQREELRAVAQELIDVEAEDTSVRLEN